MTAAKTMAEEIMLHSQIGRDEQGQFCKGCNYRYGYDAERKLNRHASAHVAAALTAAGFGLVVEAKAEAWDAANRAVKNSIGGFAEVGVWAFEQAEKITPNPYRA